MSNTTQTGWTWSEEKRDWYYLQNLKGDQKRCVWASDVRPSKAKESPRTISIRRISTAVVDQPLDSDLHRDKPHASTPVFKGGQPVDYGDVVSLKKQWQKTASDAIDLKNKEQIAELFRGSEMHNSTESDKSNVTGASKSPDKNKDTRKKKDSNPFRVRSRQPSFMGLPLTSQRSKRSVSALNPDSKLSFTKPQDNVTIPPKMPGDYPTTLSDAEYKRRKTTSRSVRSQITSAADTSLYYDSTENSETSDEEYSSDQAATCSDLEYSSSWAAWDSLEDFSQLNLENTDNIVANAVNSDSPTSLQRYNQSLPSSSSRSSSEPSRVGKLSSTGKSFGGRGEGSDQDDDDNEPVNPGQTGRSRRKKSTRPPFACPFHQALPSNPEYMYGACAGPGFQNMSKLTQHLFRSHKVIICGGCTLRFDTITEIQEHRRDSKECSKNRISDRRQLNLWDGIFSALFPAAKRPYPKPYYSKTKASLERPVTISQSQEVIPEQPPVQMQQLQAVANPPRQAPIQDSINQLLLEQNKLLQREIQLANQQRELACSIAKRLWRIALDHNIPELEPESSLSSFLQNSIGALDEPKTRERSLNLGFGSQALATTSALSALEPFDLTGDWLQNATSFPTANGFQWNNNNDIGANWNQLPMGGPLGLGAQSTGPNITNHGTKNAPGLPTGIDVVDPYDWEDIISC